MPGVGFPRWSVELIKVRNGKTGSWQVEWMGRKFRHVNNTVSLIREVPLVNKLIS
jgi:protein ImuA